MLAEIYIEALLIDEELADRVWEFWASSYISDVSAMRAWMITWRSAR